MRHIVLFLVACMWLAPLTLAQTASKHLVREMDHKANLDALAFGQAVTMIGETAFVGERLTSNGQGAVFVYRRDAASASWTLHQRLSAPNAFVGDRFGAALATDGTRLLVSATGANDGAGEAYLFTRGTDGAWTHAATLTPSAAPGTYAGLRVALSESIALLGAPDADERRGTVFVMREGANGQWSEDTIDLPQREPGGQFSVGLAAAADRVAFGAPFAKNNRGTVYVYRWDAMRAAWTLDAELSGRVAGGVAQSFFGINLGFSQGELVVAASSYNATGAVESYAFDTASTTWRLRQRLVGNFNENFGLGLHVREDTLVVGAVGINSFQGGARVYARDGSKPLWLSAGLINNPSNTQGQNVGRVVAASGPNVLIGAPSAEGNTGVAYLFRQSGSAWTAEATLQHNDGRLPALVGERRACAEGAAALFPCKDVDILAFLPLDQIGGPGRLNDVWGWTDPSTGTEYALVGRTDGTAFVDLSDPLRPRYLGMLPMVTYASTWRDMKVYQDHAFIVADGAGEHGMQVFDLTQLRSVTTPQTFTATAHYTSIGSVHNIALNTETGFAYLVGGNSGGDTCGGGLHIIDVRTPADLQFVNCYRDDRGNRGYTHDTQCTIYRGPDLNYQGREICVNSNVQAVTILDVTDKQNIVPISVVTYPDAGYIHQGWLSDDHTTFYMNDETDEFQFNVPTRTLIFDLTDLDTPEMLDPYLAPTSSTDHNLYIRGHLMYQTNYESGFRVLDISAPATPVEIAYLDTTPADVGRGTWSNYPYFESGVIPITSITEGLFLVEVVADAAAATEPEPEDVPTDVTLDLYPNPFADELQVRLDLTTAEQVKITLTDVLGRTVRTVHEGPLKAATHRLRIDTADLASGNYLIRIQTETGVRSFPVARAR
ncbi:MAG: choice-of-anchor B family protein [Rhodothermales bacterium]